MSFFCVFLQFFLISSQIKNTVFSRIEAAASICFLYFLVQFLFEGGFYSRAASIYRNSLSVICLLFTSRVIM